MLNQVIGELLEGHPVSDVKLKEVLGHTPLQVRWGCERRGSAEGMWLPPAQWWTLWPHSLPRLCVTCPPGPQVGCGAVLGVLFGVFYPAPDAAVVVAQHMLA